MVRPGLLPTARRLRTWPPVLAASSRYLDKVGAPASPDGLSDHALILGPIGVATTWSLRKGGTTKSVRVDGRLIVRTNEGVIAAAVAGLGIVMTSLGACRRELDGGALVRVLPDWDVGSVELNAVFASGRAAKPAARAFTDYLAGALDEV